MNDTQQKPPEKLEARMPVQMTPTMKSTLERMAAEQYISTGELIRRICQDAIDNKDVE